MHFSQKLKNQISLLGICSGLGQKQKGLEFGPQVLRENGISEMFQAGGLKVTDMNDLRPEENEDSMGWCLIERVRAKALESLKDKNFLFSMGGDHSISIGTIQATLIAYPNARVIWIDAHGDMNTPATSNTGNLHGMPLAALLGIFKTPIGGPLLSPRKLFVVGVRDLDPAEQMFFDDLEINYISAEEILLNAEKSYEKIGNWLKQDSNSPIHLSFDVDALDPSFAPATGIRVPLGLTVEFSKKLIGMISSSEQIVAIDLVELNPLKAQNQSELEQTIQSVKSIFSPSSAGL